MTSRKTLKLIESGEAGWEQWCPSKRWSSCANNRHLGKPNKRIQSFLKWSHPDPIHRRPSSLSGQVWRVYPQQKPYKMRVSIRLFEASDQVGGRVRTDRVDGFQLDRGFQVYLDAYPQAGKILDLPALKLKAFRPGACIYRDRRFHRMMDPFRCPQFLLPSAFSPIGRFGDKLRVGWLRHRLLRKTMAAIEASPDQTTEDYLLAQGFSRAFIDQFFRSFYGGIFWNPPAYLSAPI